MFGSRKWALPVAVLGCAVVATMSSHGRPPQPASQPSTTAEVSSFALVGVANNACLTSLAASLAALPGIDHFALDTRSVTFTPKPGWTAPLAEAVVACVRSSGHDVAGRSDPDFPPLTAEEVARLDAISSEWVVVRLGPARCSACAAITADRLREVRGVRASYRLEPGPGIAVQRQPGCKVSTIDQAARASIRGPVEVEASRALTLHIEGMQCHKCVATVSLALGRTPGVLRFDVTVGQATVVATTGTDPSRVVAAIDNAPPPT
ncbi:MAG TPA: heavy metal-associated domain-containing protein [Planctomycetota bacterium]|nr:heavy metal-associated domain-containing protein [Planctomycetota bacterium]